MRRYAITAVAVTAIVVIAGCSSSDGDDQENPGGITRIDGPAQVDSDVVVGNGSTDG